MEIVGLRDLKAHLGDYVRRSKNGERIVITDRGHEVAELTPLSDSRKAMLALRAAGRATWRGGKPKGITGQSIQGEPLAKTVLDDRR